ncbi:MAG: stage IV sporulation protein A [Clostridia bacterium]
MNGKDIYSNIAKRTNGDIYVGVVGPVRTGKSTFIKSFMESLVIPNIEGKYRKERTIDELPQSASGRTIMTTEPKFIPNESIEVKLDNNVSFKTRLVDCVGYLVDGALGDSEDDMPRMVDTPWFPEKIPFKMAAEIGTRKVIADHSTIGIIVTTDGSFTDIPRESYIDAERKVVGELKELNKPFTIILNCENPYSTSSMELARQLEDEYDAPVLAANVAELKEENIKDIFSKVLEEFPISEISFSLPSWVDSLSLDHSIKSNIINIVRQNFLPINSVREISNLVTRLKEANDIIQDVYIENASMDTGNVHIQMTINPDLFYRALSEASNLDIHSEGDIFKCMQDYSVIKTDYTRISGALEEVRIKGYGIVTPQIDELKLEEPEIFKNGSKFGVKLKASAPSIHMIRADIETEVSPIVGSEKQSEDLVKYLLSEFEADPKKIWQSNIFGKSLHELVNEGLHNKLYKMPDEAQLKLQETLTKIINEGSGGLICIIL